MDNNPRIFTFHVTEVDTNLAIGENVDRIVIKVHGRMTPRNKERFELALLGGHYEIEEYKLP